MKPWAKPKQLWSLAHSSFGQEITLFRVNLQVKLVVPETLARLMGRMYHSLESIWFNNIRNISEVWYHAGFILNISTHGRKFLAFMKAVVSPLWITGRKASFFLRRSSNKARAPVDLKSFTLSFVYRNGISMQIYILTCLPQLYNKH